MNKVPLRNALPVLIIVAGSVFAGWMLGKDRNWDLYNYHLYGPHLLLHGDLAIDFMGGGPQSYLNPMAYLPLYVAVVANFPDWAIGAMLAMLHSLNLLLIWHIAANQLFLHDADRLHKSTFSVLLATLSPVFLGTLGSTFSDPITATFVLAGLSATLYQCQARPWLPHLVTGVCIGIACGLKLSNFPFLVAGTFVAASTAVPWRSRLVAAGCFLAGALVGGGLVNGWWAWRLHEQFGNPVFPLLNDFFRSPDFPSAPVRPDRFIPHDLVEFLLFPFRIATSHSWIYTENSAPDLRPAALVIAAAVAVIAGRFARRAGGWQAVAARSLHSSTRVWVFFGVAAAIWLAGSGNGRYAIPLLLLVGPLAVGAIYQCLSARPLQRVACMLLIVMQAAVLLQSGNPRWGWVPWGGAWVQVNLPPEHIRERHGYMSFGQNSASFIAPFVNQESGFLALQGILPLRPGGHGEMRVRRFIKHYSGRLVMLFRTTANAGDFKTFPPSLAAELSLWGLAADAAGCRLIAQAEWPGGLNTLICPISEGVVPDAAFAAEIQHLGAVFDRVAAACPTRFSPVDWPLVKEGSLWVRRHVNTDTVVFLRNGRFYASRYDFGPWDEDLGSFSDWQTGTPPKISCTRPLPHYLVKP